MASNGITAAKRGAAGGRLLLPFREERRTSRSGHSNFTVSLVAAFADPQEAIEQAYERSKTFRYGMAYVAYSYGARQGGTS